MKHKQAHSLRIHLSTACLCMLFGAALLWPNCKSNRIITTEADIIVTNNHRGWPYTYWIEQEQRVRTTKPQASTASQDTYRRRTGPLGFTIKILPDDFRRSTLAINIVFSVALLAGLAIALEYSIQRREVLAKRNTDVL